MHSQLVIGNAAQATSSSTKGWVVGHFMNQGLTTIDEFEIKIWHYDSQPDYGQKSFGGTEFIIVEKGILKLELEVPDKNGVFVPNTVELDGTSRDYIIIPPGCKKRVIVVEAPTFGLCVRWPSAPGINAVIE